MKLLEAYNPSDVRACGRMVKGIIAAGGSAEDILGYAAFAERHGANPVFAKSKFTFQIPESKSLSKGELLGALGYNLLRDWIKLSREILSLEIDLDEIRSYIKSERKKDLNTTRFGWVRG